MGGLAVACDCGARTGIGLTDIDKRGENAYTLTSGKFHHPLNT